MSSFEKSIENFRRKFIGKIISISTLENDIEAMKIGIENDKPYSRQTIESMTVLRENKGELDVAKKEPDIQFIKDTIQNIMKI